MEGKNVINFLICAKYGMRNLSSKRNLCETRKRQGSALGSQQRNIIRRMAIVSAIRFREVQTRESGVGEAQSNFYSVCQQSKEIVNPLPF